MDQLRTDALGTPGGDPSDESGPRTALDSAGRSARAVLPSPGAPSSRSG